MPRCSGKNAGTKARGKGEIADVALAKPNGQLPLVMARWMLLIRLWILLEYHCLELWFLMRNCQVGCEGMELEGVLVQCLLVFDFIFL